MQESQPEDQGVHDFLLIHFIVEKEQKSAFWPLLALLRLFIKRMEHLEETGRRRNHMGLFHHPSRPSTGVQRTTRRNRTCFF